MDYSMEMDNNRPPTEYIGNNLEDDLFGEAYIPEQPLQQPEQPVEQLEQVEPVEEDDGGDDLGLFGGDSDEDDVAPVIETDTPMDEDNKPSRQSTPEEANEEDNLSESTKKERARQEYPESDGEGAMRNLTANRTVATIPILNVGQPPESKVWHARLPTFLALVKTAFVATDDTTWENEIEPVLEAESSQRKNDADEVKAVHNVADEDKIRWRWTQDPLTAETIKQSNSRVVRWSDGSLSLQIGSEQYAISASLDHTAPILSPPAPIVKAENGSTPSVVLSQFDDSRGHGLTFLASAQDSSLLTESNTMITETHASIHGTLTFRPMTTSGKTHKRLAGTIAEKYVKGRGIKLALTEEDPEKKRMDREKEELEKIKAAKRAKGANKGSRGGKGEKRSTKLVLGSDEDDGEDEDEDDDEDETRERARSRRSNPKRGRGGPLAQEDEEEEEEEEEDDGFVVRDVDDDDDDGPERVGAGSRRRLGEVLGDGMDDVDEADKRIEREEKRRKAEVDDGPVMEVRRRLVVEDDEDE